MNLKEVPVHSNLTKHDEAKGCPKCGSKNVKVRAYPWDTDGDPCPTIEFECCDCELLWDVTLDRQDGEIDMLDVFEKGIEAWNERPDMPSELVPLPVRKFPLTDTIIRTGAERIEIVDQDGEPVPGDTPKVIVCGGVEYRAQRTCHPVSMDELGRPPYNTSGLQVNSATSGCSECGCPWGGHDLPRHCKNCGVLVTSRNSRTELAERRSRQR